MRPRTWNNPEHVADLQRRFWASVDAGIPDAPGCWEWRASTRTHGYGQIHAMGRQEPAHRVSWILTNGDIPDGAWVLHKCDNPLCVRPSHLYLGDCKQNAKDMMERARGRFQFGTKEHPVPRGESHPQRKFTAEQIMQIRAEHKSGASTLGLGRKYGVSQGSIWNIVNYKTWKLVP